MLKLLRPGDENAEVILDIVQVRPAHITLSPTGKRLFGLAGLAAIANSNDLQRLADLLSIKPPIGDVRLGGAASLRNK
jgi:hypothetical protein